MRGLCPSRSLIGYSQEPNDRRSRGHGLLRRDQRLQRYSGEPPDFGFGSGAELDACVRVEQWASIDQDDNGLRRVRSTHASASGRA